MEDSHEGTKPRRDKEEISAVVVDCALRLHRDLGPGLLETVYEVVLAKLLKEQGLKVERQKPIPIRYAGFSFEEGFRADLIVDGVVLVELKSLLKTEASITDRNRLLAFDLETLLFQQLC